MNDERDENKTEAMDRAERHANKVWLEQAYNAVCVLALHQDKLTTDDVWHQISKAPGIDTHEHRAMGPIMQRAARAKLIEKTSYTAKCTRASRNCGDVRVWRSLVFRGAPT